MPGASVARVEQRLKLTDDVIRHLLVVADEDMPAPAASTEAPAVDGEAAAAA
jgi:ribosomal protein S6